MLKKDLNNLYGFLILFLALFLRLWKLYETIPFIGDFGWYYLQAKDVLTQGYLPLVGIPSSVPILHQGALWTYMLAGIMALGNFHPLSGGILGAILGTAGVFLTYKVGQILFNSRIALIASTWAAIFPFIVFHDRIPYHTTPIFPLTLIFVYFFKKVFENPNTKGMFLMGLFWGVLFQFELASVVLIPIFLSVYLIRQVIISMKLATGFIGGVFWGGSSFCYL